MAEPCCMILTTTGDPQEAERIAELLVTRRLAACVQTTSITSRYVWKGQFTREDETLLLIKTTTRLALEVERAIRENHSYEVPEIIQVPIERGLDAYLQWITESTT